MGATDTLNPTQGLSFNLTDLHGYVTGTLYGDWGTTATSVFAMAARHDDPEDAKYRMVHIELGRKIADRSYGSEYTVKSWRWIDRDDFDRIIGMNEIRASFGWRAT
ncbi:hypothetical protein KBG_82 [Mycobacterium phage KBG]|uniref:Uncharacterized protein n=1 Tax=Mycobacterium phage KBG TaxID=2914011 RepID=B3VG53_9CAUD|nr:hypothetical protein KBG_82 [Mycobacterium phage KBG]ACE79830.1 hypothetical protein KBG_82 [Mycobacterium phage KBG]